MPLILFLISVLVSSSFYLVLERVTQDSLVNQSLLASTAAFYTANSSAEVSWSEVVPEQSLQRISVFDEMARKNNEFRLASAGDEPEHLELNQGIESMVVQRKKSLRPDPLSDVFYQSSAEVFLYEVPTDQVIDSVWVDYCFSDATCPELIIEWFRLDKDFRFHDLKELKNLHSDTSPINPCLDNSMTHIQRCVVRSSAGSKNVLHIEHFLPKKFFELQTDFPSYHYLIRFRSLDRTPFHFRISGIKGNKETGLPTAYFEVDELAQTRNTFRRIRQQQMVSGGLQDGLEFVHYSEIVDDK